MNALKRCHAATLPRCHKPLLCPRLLYLCPLAFGHCNCWPFNKRSQKCFSFRLSLSLCLYLLQLWFAILLYCHRCLILLQASPVCHFLTSRGRVRCPSPVARRPSPSSSKKKSLGGDSFVCHCRKLNFKLFSQLST